MKMNTPCSFGHYLRQKRKEAHVTQRALAASTRVDHTYISKIEHDSLEHMPSVATLLHFAKALCIPEEEILLRAGACGTNHYRQVLAGIIERAHETIAQARESHEPESRCEHTLRVIAGLAEQALRKQKEEETAV